MIKYHIFCCTTQRPPGHTKPSCGPRGAHEIAGYMWEKLSELGQEGVKINTSSCLGRCEMGPVMVIYPEGTWYMLRSKADADEIIDTHAAVPIIECDSFSYGRVLSDRSSRCQHGLCRGRGWPGKGQGCEQVLP